jgi:uncharacterized protein (TIGR02246 family)
VRNRATFQLNARRAAFSRTAYPSTEFGGSIVNKFIRITAISLSLLVPTWANASPIEDANAVVDSWSAAYTSNDPEAIVKLYAPDAILLGTISPVISTGTESIRKYFSRLKGSGNKNVIQERRTITLGEDAVVITGFYEFSSLKDGTPLLRPSRFTMLVTKRNGEWNIAHHHSSPHVKSN